MTGLSTSDLTERSDLPDSVFAFPKQRKEPLTDASHVRNAIARFDQTIGVSDEDRELAFANIKKAAKYGVDMTETDWTQLGRTPHTGRTAEDRRKSARKAWATRKGARARRIVDGARCERTFEFAIEVYTFRVAFVLLLTRRLARSV